MSDQRVLAVLQKTPALPADRWRIEIPFRALIARGYDAWVCSPLEARQFQGGKTIDALVQMRVAMNRPFVARTMRKALDTTNTRFVIDYDDMIDKIPKHNEYYKLNPPWSWHLNALAIADCVTVSTQRLVTWMRDEHKVSCPVVVLPNRVVPGLYPKVGHERLTVGLTGSPSHRADWHMILPALTRLVKDFPTVRFLVFGAPLPELDGPNVERHDWLSWGGYIRQVGQCDIALCPLTTAEFNYGKSPLKWTEFSSIGVPCVVSPVVYDVAVTHNKTALIAYNQGDWYSQVSALILNPDLRHQIGQAAKAEIDLNWTENDLTLQARWEAYTGVNQWKSVNWQVPSSSESRRLPSLV